jgi:hypothetical protein
MLADDSSTRASQALPRTGGGPMLPLRAKVFIDIGSRDLKSTGSREAQSRKAA